MNSKKIKKTILMISGPGVILLESIALFVHLFTTENTKIWIIGGLLVFFIVFIPLYTVEYFKENSTKKENNLNIRYKRRTTRTEWVGGNIHGKTPMETERPGKIFKN